MTLDTLSDLDLTILLKDDDHGAYEEIYRRYHMLLYLYAYKKLKDKEAAKDLIQEIFLALWNKRRSYTFHADLAGYLYRAVRNRAFDIFAHQRVEQKYVDSLQSYLNTDTATADHLLREKEIQTMIDNEIALMPKGMREVFELSRKQYLTHKEIAEKLDMSEDAVNKQIKRALKLLRVRLGFTVYALMMLECVKEDYAKTLPENILFSYHQNVPLP
ncbi:MAG: polymerase subunit sigma-70 [Mucilaginibacter sp.]|nr:polymerase subunit sigma-70 [Mucilaginibacter sp.]